MNKYFFEIKKKYLKNIKIKEMNSLQSLQILALLSTDKIDELKQILIPKTYYSLVYESVNIPNLSSVSECLFENKETLMNYFTQVLDIMTQKKYPTCQICDEGRDQGYDQGKICSREEVRKHFEENDHYAFDNLIYKLTVFKTLL